LEKPISKAEQQLQEIATKGGVSMKTIYALCNQVFIEDTNYQEKVQRMRQIDVQARQLQLMDIQTANERINNILLSRVLNNRMRRMTRMDKIKKLFTWHRGTVAATPPKI
jgi:hypothetical protein